MSFIERFEEVKKVFKDAKATDIKEHLAIQINLTDADSSGIMYLEVADGNVIVEPYDYVDRDAMFVVTSEDLIAIAKGKLAAEKAMEEGKLVVLGNLEKAALVKSIKLKAKKAPAKKAPAKKAAPKAEAKVEEAPKAEEVKAPAKKAPAKKAAPKAEAKVEAKVEAPKAEEVKAPAKEAPKAEVKAEPAKKAPAKKAPAKKASK